MGAGNLYKKKPLPCSPLPRRSSPIYITGLSNRKSELLITCIFLSPTTVPCIFNSSFFFFSWRISRPFFINARIKFAHQKEHISHSRSTFVSNRESDLQSGTVFMCMPSSYLYRTNFTQFYKILGSPFLVIRSRYNSSVYSDRLAIITSILMTEHSCEDSNFFVLSRVSYHAILGS